MTQTGGFDFLIAWALFLALLGVLAGIVLHRAGAEHARQREPAGRDAPGTGRDG